MTSSSVAWTREHLAGLVDDPVVYTPVIRPEDVDCLLPGIDLWDLWPIRSPDGTVPAVCGSRMWAALSAPAVGHPGRRHDHARIRLVAAGERWEDGGPLFPAGGSAGSREWAGSLILDAGVLHAFYTAVGRRGEAVPTFGQRIIGASAPVDCRGNRLRVGPWSEHRELVQADRVRYQPAIEETGQPGFIKAFRDPCWFRDPATGAELLLFTASLAGAETEFNGAIGIARRQADGWELGDPLVTADGVNNELERPHLVVHEGRYYLFFSTQQRTFHPAVSGPTGLYGFVGPSASGPFEPLNGSGLVLCNPPAEPFQAYSWLVLNDLWAVSFVDSHSLAGRHPDQLEADGEHTVRRHFGGTMAPPVRLHLQGAEAHIGEVGSVASLLTGS